jgi:hypothetical protein
MSSASLLGYYTDDKSQQRRPPIVTAVAITGIVLCAILLFLQAFAGPSSSQRMNSGAMSAAAQSFGIGYALGRLIGIGFQLLMLVGCCGLLSLRWMGRLLVWIAAYGWFALGALAIVLLLYAVYGEAATSPRGAPAGPRVGLIALAVLQIAVQLGFAAWAMVVIRRVEIAALFTRETEAPPVPQVLKILSVITLVYAGAGLLVTLVELLGIAGQIKEFENVHASRVLASNPYGFTAGRFLDLLLGLALNAGFVCGCILVLLNRAVGARVIAICCIAKLAFTIGLWTPDNYATGLFGPYGSKSALAEVYRFLWAFSQQVIGVMFPAVLLAVFTYRPAMLPAVAPTPMPPARPTVAAAAARATSRPTLATPAAPRVPSQAPQSAGRRPPPLKQKSLPRDQGDRRA